MSDPPADVKGGTPPRPTLSIPDSRTKQESPSPHGGDSAVTASHASATPSSSCTPSPRSSPSAPPSTQDLPAAATGAPRAREKRERRKRSRVNAEQLAVLEAIFAADRSPTAVRRKEISEQLGMHERQTQIWFQNRRAKAKQAEGGKAPPKAKRPSSSPSSPAEAAPSPSHQTARYPSQDLDLKKRIHEDDPVTVIPCTELSIGSWTRVSSDKKGRQHDLLAYVCEARRRLTWYVHYHEQDVEHAVKMDIPFDSVADITLTRAGADTAQAALYLAQPPVFYMEVRSPDAGRAWVPCGDWTAHHQATHVLLHELCGAAAPLTYLWKRICAERQLSPPFSRPLAQDIFSPPPAFAPGFLGDAARLHQQQQQQQQQALFGAYAPAPYSGGALAGMRHTGHGALGPLMGQGADGSPSFAHAYAGRAPGPMPPQPPLALAPSLSRRAFAHGGPAGPPHALFLGEPPPQHTTPGEQQQHVAAPVPETPIDIGAFWMNVG